jgi:hypothetical protein
MKDDRLIIFLFYIPLETLTHLLKYWFAGSGGDFFFSK